MGQMEVAASPPPFVFFASLFPHEWPAGEFELTQPLATVLPLRATAECAVRRVQRGFTLIELMVVLVIIGVLAALIVPNVLDRADDARVTAAKTDVNNLMQALKLYRLDNQRYPTSEQSLQALVNKPSASPVPPNWRPYLEKLPADPWNQPYRYLNPGVYGEVDVLSLGADGQPGGEGKNADVGSWN
jgi:general secretion pathway protein G